MSEPVRHVGVIMTKKVVGFNKALWDEESLCEMKPMPVMTTVGKPATRWAMGLEQN